MQRFLTSFLSYVSFFIILGRPHPPYLGTCLPRNISTMHTEPAPRVKKKVIQTQNVVPFKTSPKLGAPLECFRGAALEVDSVSLSGGDLEDLSLFYHKEIKKINKNDLQIRLRN